jgi:hypothetical protein
MKVSARLYVIDIKLNVSPTGGDLVLPDTPPQAPIRAWRDLSLPFVIEHAVAPFKGDRTAVYSLMKGICISVNRQWIGKRRMHVRGMGMQWMTTRSMYWKSDMIYDYDLVCLTFSSSRSLVRGNDTIPFIRSRVMVNYQQRLCYGPFTSAFL